MRVLVLEDFGRMAVEERPDPVPGPSDVLIEIVATGICGSDVHGFSGENGRRVPGQVMGHETVGRVRALGSATTAFEIGQPVTVNPVVIPESARTEYVGREQHCPDKYVIGVRADRSAAFAELLVAPASNVVPISADTPILLGALIEPLAVAVHAIARVAPQPGERVLIVGGGPIGQSVALALSLMTGEEAVVAELDPSRRALIERLGARTLDPQAPTFAEEAHRELGGEADVVIDAVGVEATLRTAFAMSRLGARICLVGMGAPVVPLDAFRISVEERTLVGSFTYSDGDFRRAAAMIGEEPARAGVLISELVPLADAPTAFERAAAGVGAPGKTLVQFGDPDADARTVG